MPDSGGVTNLGAIQVKIEGDPTGLERAAQRAAKTLDDMETRATKAQDKLAKSAETLAKAQERCSNLGADATEKAMDKAGKALEKATDAYAKTEAKATAAATKLADAQEKEMARAARAADKGAEQVAASIARLAQKTTEASGRVAGGLSKLEAAFASSLGKIDKSVKGIGNLQAFSVLGNALSGAAREIKAGMSAATAPAEEFDLRMRYVNTSLALSEAPFQAYSKQVLALSESMTNITYDAAKMADGLYPIVGAGFDGARAIETLRQATLMATAGMTEIKPTADLLTTVMTSYKLSADQAGTAADILSAAVAKGKVTFAEMAQAIGPATVKSAAYGISLEELVSGFVLLTQHGIKAAEATTVLERTMMSIVAPTAKQEALMQSIGVAYGRSAVEGGKFGESLTKLIALAATDSEIRKMVGSVEALTGIQTLATNGGQEFADMLAKIQHAAGSTMSMTNEMARSSSEQWKMLQKDFNNMAIAMKDSLLPHMESLATKGRDVIKAFSDLSPETKKFAIQGAFVASSLAAITGAAVLFAAAVVALGPAITWIGGCIAAFVLSGTAPLTILFATVAATWAIDQSTMREGTIKTLMAISAYIEGWTPPPLKAPRMNGIEGIGASGEVRDPDTGKIMRDPASFGMGDARQSSSSPENVEYRRKYYSIVAALTKQDHDSRLKERIDPLAGTYIKNVDPLQGTYVTQYGNSTPKAGTDTRLYMSEREKADRDGAEAMREATKITKGLGKAMDDVAKVARRYGRSGSAASSSGNYPLRDRVSQTDYIRQHAGTSLSPNLGGLDDPTLSATYKTVANSVAAGIRLEVTSAMRNSKTFHGQGMAVDFQLPGHTGFNDPGAADKIKPLLTGFRTGIDEYRYPSAHATGGHIHATTGVETTTGSFTVAGGSVQQKMKAEADETAKYIAAMDKFLGREGTEFDRKRSELNASYAKLEESAKTHGASQDALSKMKAQHLAALDEVAGKEANHNQELRNDKAKIIGELAMMAMEADGRAGDAAQLRAQKHYVEQMAHIDELVRKGQDHPEINAAGLEAQGSLLHTSGMAAFARLSTTLGRDADLASANQKDLDEKKKDMSELELISAESSGRIGQADLLRCRQHYDAEIARINEIERIQIAKSNGAEASPLASQARAGAGVGFSRDQADLKAKHAADDISFQRQMGIITKQEAFRLQGEILNNYKGSKNEERAIQLTMAQEFQTDLKTRLEKQGIYNLASLEQEKAKYVGLKLLTGVQQAELAAIKMATVDVQMQQDQAEASQRQQLIAQAESSLATFMSSVAMGQQSFGAAFKSMWQSIASTVVGEISKIIAKLLVMKAIMLIAGLITGGASSIGSAADIAGMDAAGSGGSLIPEANVGHSGGNVTRGGIIPSFHSGGLVGLRQDELVAKLQVGEYVMSRAQVAETRQNAGNRNAGNTTNHFSNSIQATIASSYDVNQLAAELGFAMERQMRGSV